MYNYYKATWSRVTAKRAKLLGVNVSRSYGYYVLIDPPNFEEGKKQGRERIQSWCKTKQIAEHEIESCVNAQKKGYYGCLCGSNKQAAGCCGIPNGDN